MAYGAPGLLASGSEAGPVAENAPATGPALVPAPEATAAQPTAAEEDKKGYEGSWSYEAGEGMRWSSADGDVQVEFGGRIQLDWAFQGAAQDIEDAFDGNGGGFTDGVEFRRARLKAEGTLYERVGFKAEYDFAGGEAAFTDVYMSLNDLFSTMDARVGHFKEPQGLEQLTGANYLTFMERSLSDALVPARNTGAALSDTLGANNINWSIGVFRDTDNFGDDTNSAGNGVDDGQYNVTGRLSGTPLYEEDGTQVVHLGLSFSYRDADEGVRFRSRPEDHQAPYVVDTGTIDAKNSWTGGVEAAWVMNQLSLQGEYLLSRVDDVADQNPDFWGFYVFASYFLTGEHRPYRPKDGSFGRVKPKTNWGQGGGGAWELAARYSKLDLTDSGYDGGDLQDVTAGANWYLNPNARIMFNFVYGDLDGTAGVDGPIRAFLMRFQVDF